MVIVSASVVGFVLIVILGLWLSRNLGHLIGRNLRYAVDNEDSQDDSDNQNYSSEGEEYAETAIDRPAQNSVNESEGKF